MPWHSITRYSLYTHLLNSHHQRCLILVPVLNCMLHYLSTLQSAFLHLLSHHPIHHPNNHRPHRTAGKVRLNTWTVMGLHSLSHYLLLPITPLQSASEVGLALCQCAVTSSTSSMLHCTVYTSVHHNVYRSADQYELQPPLTNLAESSYWLWFM